MLVDIMKQLEEFGTEQNRKVYKRHGIGDNQFGVSYGNLKTLKKQVKTNHELALELWETGNHDARIFATQIADPKKATDKQLEQWVHDLDNYVISDAVSVYAASSPLAKQKAEVWMNADDEWIEQVGWNILAHLAAKDQSLPDDYFVPFLDTIENDIHNCKNRVRHTMNGALIAIGARSDVLEKRAVEVAKKIGVVVVDHGETGCKTPDAIGYIAKTRARKK